MGGAPTSAKPAPETVRLGTVMGSSEVSGFKTVKVRVALPGVPAVTCPKLIGVAASGSWRTPVWSTYEIWSASMLPTTMPVPTSGYVLDPITSVAAA